MHMC